MTHQRIAVVTGGLTGIGLAAARALARGGARVAIGARRAGDPAKTSAARAELGASIYLAPLDVRSTDSVTDFFAGVEAALGPVDILVNAAGIYVPQRIAGHSLEVWRDTLDTNLTGPFLTIRACLAGMMDRGWGRVVNVASTSAQVAEPGYAAYCASKAGLLGLSRTVAAEGAAHGVTCVTVSPTWVETDMLRDSAARNATQSGSALADEIAAMARLNPQNRLVQPDEIGALIAFLASDAAPGLTMEDIQVNAGAVW